MSLLLKLITLRASSPIMTTGETPTVLGARFSPTIKIVSLTKSTKTLMIFSCGLGCGFAANAECHDIKINKIGITPNRAVILTDFKNIRFASSPCISPCFNYWQALCQKEETKIGGRIGGKN